ncbi:MAG: glycosyltransferase family 4 protein [Vicinamibacterales bacterium]
MSAHTGAAAPGGIRRVVFLPTWPDNPYQELLAAGLGALGVEVVHVARRLWFLPSVWSRGRPEVVHLHAPDHFVVYRCCAPAALAALVITAVQLVLLRRRGVRIVWTVHDLMNHERRYPVIDRWCRRLTARLSDALIVHCASAHTEAAAALGVDAAPISVVPHGHYLSAYPSSGGGRAAARAALGLPHDGTLLLFLGNIRRHKGVDGLLQAFARLERPGTRLVVAGQPFDAEIGGEIAALAGRDPDVTLRLATVPDNQIGQYMAAANVVVCPFTSSLTSGSLVLALSHARAVVVPRLGCAPDMVGDDGGFLHDAGAPDGLVRALRAAVDAAPRLDGMGLANRSRVEGHDWAGIAAQTLAVYESGVIG